jgi:hypothetical protein
MDMTMSSLRPPEFISSWGRLPHLRKIQRHKVRINQAEPLEGVSTISEAQAQVLNALKVNKPIKNEQMSLL